MKKRDVVLFGIDFCFRHDNNLFNQNVSFKRSADMQSQSSHTGMICMGVLICLFMLALQTGSIAAGPSADQKGSGRSTENSTAAPRSFSTSFLSLSPGHTISTSLFIFSDGDAFEIKIPGVDCREPAGAYTTSGLMFAADFSATVLKQKKHYRYAFSAKGISLFGSYIAGTMVLDEQINETGQQQKVTFVFWGTSEAAGTDEEKNLFPF